MNSFSLTNNEKFKILELLKLIKLALSKALSKEDSLHKDIEDFKTCC